METQVSWLRQPSQQKRLLGLIISRWPLNVTRGVSMLDNGRWCLIPVLWWLVTHPGCYPPRPICWESLCDPQRLTPATSDLSPIPNTVLDAAFQGLSLHSRRLTTPCPVWHVNISTNNQAYKCCHTHTRWHTSSHRETNVHTRAENNSVKY